MLKLILQGESIERAPTAVLNDSCWYGGEGEQFAFRKQNFQQSEAPVVNKKGPHISTADIQYCHEKKIYQKKVVVPLLQNINMLSFFTFRSGKCQNCSLC